MIKDDVTFNGPVPGQSLMKEPGGQPWEKPPELSDPDQVIDFYLTRLNSDKQVKKILTVLQAGLPIEPLVESMLTMGVGKGLHSIDMSLVVAPVIHEYIKGLAEDAGITPDDGFEDKQQELDDEEALSEMAMMKKFSDIEREAGVKKKEPVQEVQDTPVVDEASSFMTRRT